MSTDETARIMARLSREAQGRVLDAGRAALQYFGGEESLTRPSGAALVASWAAIEVAIIAEGGLRVLGRA